MRSSRRGVVLAAAAGLIATSADAVGQAKSAVIRGVVVTGTATNRRPIEGARVLLVGTTHATVTDAKGGFILAQLDPGNYIIQAAAIGYTTLTSPLVLKDQQTVDVEFETEAEAVRLPDLAVEEAANHGPVDWLRRRTEGRGRYITRKHIEDRRASTVPDALRMVPGLRIECRGSHVCVARMARAPRGCGPAYFMDGIPTDPAALWLTPIHEIEGIEVYSGPAETPPELESVQARCGVIVLWTRPPPPRRPREKKPKPADTAAAKPDSSQA